MIVFINRLKLRTLLLARHHVEAIHSERCSAHEYPRPHALLGRVYELERQDYIASQTDQSTLLQNTFWRTRQARLCLSRGHMRATQWDL